MAEAAAQLQKPRRIAPSPEEGGETKNPISLPLFLMMLQFAVIADLADLVEFIPIVGTVISVVISAVVGVILGALLWISGARGTRQLVTLLLGIIAESVPFISILPLNIVMVILVYLFSTERVSQVLARAPQLAKKLPAVPSA